MMNAPLSHVLRLAAHLESWNGMVYMVFGPACVRVDVNCLCNSRIYCMDVCDIVQ